MNRPRKCGTAALQHQSVGGAALTVLGALVLLISAVEARIVPIGPAFQVNTTFVPGDERSQQPPHVVVLPHGGFVVIWDGVGELGWQPAIGRHFDAAGSAVGPEFQLEGVLGDPPIIGTGGSLVSSFVYNGQGGLVLGAFTPDGVLTAIEPAEAVIDNSGGMSLAATPQQDFVLVWSDLNTILGQRFDESLHAFNSSFLVSVEGIGNLFPKIPAIATHPDGGFGVVWFAEFSSALWSRQFDAQGMPAGESFSIVEPGQVAEPFGGPLGTCFHENGDFVVAWHDYYHPIEFRRYDAEGHPLTPRLSTAIGGTVSLACLPQRRFVVAGLAPAGVVARAFDPDSRPLGYFAIPAPPPCRIRPHYSSALRGYVRDCLGPMCRGGRGGVQRFRTAIHPGSRSRLFRRLQRRRHRHCARTSQRGRRSQPRSVEWP